MRMHMGHLALRVSDIERSAEHLSETLGLRRTMESAEGILLSPNEKHHEIQLLAGPRAGVDHIGLEVEDERDLDGLRDALIAAGAEILSESPEEAGIATAIRALGPMEVVFELYTAMQREPLSIEHYMPPLARRFGHVTLATDQHAEMRRFLIDVLGFRITDVLGDRVTWMRCDTDHHGIALVDAGKNELHHYAFEVENWSAIQRYCDHLAFQGRSLVWGPGRHGPGRNLYTYAADPEHAIVEAYADLFQVPDEANYIPIDWSTMSPERAYNLWGPPPPPDWRDYGVPLLAPARAESG